MNEKKEEKMSRDGKKEESKIHQKIKKMNGK